jgi:hypothetical protein
MRSSTHHDIRAEVVAELAKRGIRPMRGGAWTAAAVRNALRRSGA